MKKNVLALSIHAWLSDLRDERIERASVTHAASPARISGRAVKVRFSGSVEDTMPFGVFLPAGGRKKGG